MVIGESDVGKTTLVTALAKELARRKRSVAVVDADLGQSEIGPPTTIGLGRVGPSLTRLSEAKLVAMAFVGSTSPARRLRATVLGTSRMVERARRLGFARILIDTSGLIRGPLGHALKRAKIDRVRPDILIVLQRADECEELLRRYEGGRVAIVRLLAADRGRRSPAVRARHRRRAFARYFANARTTRLDLSCVGVDREPATASAPDLTGGSVVGLGDRSGETLGLGIVRRLDGATRKLTIATPVPQRRIASVMIGQEKLCDMVTSYPTLSHRPRRSRRIRRGSASRRLVPVAG